jgi:hypothetical protein
MGIILPHDSSVSPLHFFGRQSFDCPLHRGPRFRRSIAVHRFELPDFVESVRVSVLPVKTNDLPVVGRWTSCALLLASRSMHRREFISRKCPLVGC